MSPAESGTLAEPRSVRATVNKKVLLIAVLSTVVVLDVLTKAWAMSSLTFGHPVPVLGEFFRLTYTHNPGAAFGINIGEHSRLFFLVHHGDPRLVARLDAHQPVVGSANRWL